MAEDAKFGSIGNSVDCENKMVQRLPLTSKNSNKATGYLNSKLSKLLPNWGKHLPKL